MTPQTPKTCAFCKRKFAGDGRRSYCCTACREGLVRADPARHRVGGFYVPLRESPLLSHFHALTAPNIAGSRTTACGIYGRFVPGLNNKFETWDPDAPGACGRCDMALAAWNPPALVEEGMF